VFQRLYLARITVLVGVTAPAVGAEIPAAVVPVRKARRYAAHRMHLLHIAVTRRWQAALYYDQQGA
jgi:hypothetical protein